MQLKDVTPIIRQILEERGKIPLFINQGRYIPNWVRNTFGDAVRSGLRKALRVIEQAPVVDAVPVVRCKDCVHRGNWNECPMVHEEVFYDEDDGSDYVTFDNTNDDGFCDRGSKVLEV